MSMNHAQNWTRPDLTYLVTKVAKFMQAPGEVHIRAEKGTTVPPGEDSSGVSLRLQEATATHRGLRVLRCFHADDVDTRKSTIAYVFFYSGCAISWKSKLHTYVTTSTNASELVAAAMAAREAKFLWKFFGALNIPADGGSSNSHTIDLFTDSIPEFCSVGCNETHGNRRFLCERIGFKRNSDCGTRSDRLDAS